jgi:hypothetical protein
MASNTLKMALKVWDSLTDPYNHNELASNWAKLDAHDHTTGKGAQLTGAALVDGTIEARHMASGVLDTGVDPASVTTLPTTGLTDGLIVPWKPAITANYGVTWMMRYNSSAPTYKWELVGGIPIQSWVETISTARVSTGFSVSSQGNVQDFVIPYTGEWKMIGEVGSATNTQIVDQVYAAGTAIFALQPGVVSGTGTEAQDVAKSVQFMLGGLGQVPGTLAIIPSSMPAHKERSIIVQAGATVGLRYKAANYDVNIYGKYFSLIPVRVTG